MERAAVYKLIEEHYIRNKATLVKKLQNSCGSYHNAEDTVQEAYVRACNYFSNYDSTLSFDAWFGGILSNCIRDCQKQQILKGMVQDDLAAISDPPRLDATDAILIQQIANKIKSKPKRVAAVLRLFLLEEYSGKEVSDLTGYTAEAVRKIVSRFRQEELAPA